MCFQLQNKVLVTYQYSPGLISDLLHHNKPQQSSWIDTSMVLYSYAHWYQDRQLESEVNWMLWHKEQ